MKIKVLVFLGAMSAHCAAFWGSKPKNTPAESNDSQKQACTQKISPLRQIGPETPKNKATGQHSSAPFENFARKIFKF